MIRLAAKEPDCMQISASLEHIEGRKEEALACMRDLEIEFNKIKKTEYAEKVGDEGMIWLSGWIKRPTQHVRFWQPK